LQEADAEITKRYPQTTVSYAIADLGKKEETLALAKKVLTAFGAPDIVINNAGNFEPGSVHNEPDGTLERQIETNLYSAYHLTRALLPAMMKKKKGHIFNMCSVASVQAYENGGAYSISKSGLLAFSKNLREEMKEQGIKVTSIIAGAVMTDSWSAFDNSKQRIMLPSDIAKLVYACTQLSPAACVEEILIRPQLGDL
jgi:short-subunit dehydrogenase